VDKKPDQIEREIREQREAITSRISALQERVRKDVDSVKTEAQDRAAGLKNQASQSLNLDTQVQEHPLASLAGAFGVGVVLGVLSDSGGPSAANFGAQTAGRGGSALGDLASSLWGMAGAGVQDEIRAALRDGVRNVTGRQSSNGERLEGTQERSAATA
jgi:ElaB/YqjD/DUF883 family membrane-anchored ribosome-binding protein